MSETMPDTVKVFDTWVTGKNGRLHFDVMTTNEATALKLAKQYLEESRRKAGLPSRPRNASSVHSEPVTFGGIDSGSSKKTAQIYRHLCLPRNTCFRMD